MLFRKTLSALVAVSSLTLGATAQFTPIGDGSSGPPAFVPSDLTPVTLTAFTRAATNADQVATMIDGVIPDGQVAREWGHTYFDAASSDPALIGSFPVMEQVGGKLEPRGTLHLALHEGIIELAYVARIQSGGEQDLVTTIRAATATQPDHVLTAKTTFDQGGNQTSQEITSTGAAPEGACEFLCVIQWLSQAGGAFFFYCLPPTPGNLGTCIVIQGLIAQNFVICLTNC